MHGTRPPEKDTNAYKLKIWARNTGKVFAQYINSFILVPVQLLPTREISLNMDRLEQVDGKDYFRNYQDNTVRDATGVSRLHVEYGPSRIDPILPGLSHYWEITLQRDSEHLKREDLFIKWTVHADNAPPNSGEIRTTDIDVVDSAKPNIDVLAEEDDL